MRITEDTYVTTRDYTVRIEDVEDMQRRFGKQWFKPERVEFRTVDGKLRDVTVAGPVRLKSGATSGTIEGNAQWYGQYDLDEAPEWVHAVLRKYL